MSASLPSISQPRQPRSDVFISHSWDDKHDVLRLVSDLKTKYGIDVWLDNLKIAEGANLYQEVIEGIRTSRVFLFILSPGSVSSKWCIDEISYAHDCRKTILVANLKRVDASLVPAPLKDILFIPSTGEFADDYERSLQTIADNVKTDRSWRDLHTDLLSRAYEWNKNKRNRSQLLGLFSYSN